MALLSFWAFGNAVSANPIENLPDTPWVRAYLFANLAGAVPLLALGQIVLFLKVCPPFTPRFTYLTHTLCSRLSSHLLHHSVELVLLLLAAVACDAQRL